MGLAAAVIGAGAIGGIASVVSGSNQASAAKSAANAQTQANNAAIAEQQREFGINQQNLQPWLKAGQSALGQYQDLSGANGAAPQQSAITALQSNPLYTSMLNQGNQAILANASATGGLRSGNVNYNLANFDANALASVYQQQLGSLGALSGLGNSTGGTLGSLGAATSGNISNLLSQNGSANAGGILSSAGALGAGINGGLSSLLGGLTQGAMLGGFGGFGGLGSAVGGASPYAATQLAGLF
jgi:hypothetical protein